MANGRPSPISHRRAQVRTKDANRVVPNRRGTLLIRIGVLVAVVLVIAALVLPLVNNGTRF